MTNFAFANYFVASVALSFLLGLPADAAHKQKPSARRHILSDDISDESRAFAYIPGKDKILQSVGISKVTQESNRQALQLLAKKSKSANKDIVISPAGATAVYLLLLNSLSGSSRNDLARAMKVDQTSDVHLAKMTADYLKSLSSSTPECEVGVAGVTNPPFAFQAAYAKLLRDKLGGLALNDTNHQLNQLRDYIQKKTRGKFGDTLTSPPPGVIRLYSTLYFNGIWSSEFQTKETRTEAFHKADGTTVMVPMMHQGYQSHWLHLTSKSFQAVRMPYQPSTNFNNTFDAMYIILPNKGIPLHRLLDELANTGLNPYSSGWRIKQGTLSIPRFKINNELMTPLPSSKGNEFNPSKASLSAMVQNATPPKNIETKQFTGIDFNERGTIATSLIECSLSLGGSNIECFDMKIDRPFAFILGNARTGSYLFAGTVQNPKDSKMPFAEAEHEWLTRLATIDKKDSYAHATMVQKLAQFYRMEGKLSKAEAVLNDVLKTVEPNSSIQLDIFYDLAETLVASKKYDKAGQVYKQLLLISRRQTAELPNGRLHCLTLDNYERALKGYAHLLSLMKADPTSVHKEQEHLYKRLVTKELDDYVDTKGGDPSNKACAMEHVVWAEEQLAEFYISTGNEKAARDTFKSCIASGLKSPQPNYSQMIYVGKNYLQFLKRTKFDLESRKLQLELNKWTMKINPPVKVKRQSKRSRGGHHN